MCQIEKPFILRSKPAPKVYKRDSETFDWALSRFVKEDEGGMDVQFEPSSSSIAQNLNNAFVIKQLNAGECFDFPYSPKERDWLWIKEPGISYQRRYLGFYFESGEWKGNNLPPHFSIYEPLSSGELEFSEKTRFNSLRSYLLGEISKSKLDNPSFPVLSYLETVLNQIEEFDVETFANEKDCIGLLRLIMEKAKTDLGAPLSKEFKKIDEALFELTENPIQTPSVALRRQLGAAEWNGLWRKFQANLGGKAETMLFEDAKVDAWKEKMIQNEQKLYKLSASHHKSSYELSSKWIETMLEGDDSYWIDCMFRWAMRIDGFGYCYAIGDF